MKADKKATVVEAARALLEVCDGAATRDGQGFNGADSPIARSICSQNFITPKQASLLHKILKKYAAQLSGLGFTYSKLDVPKSFTKYGGEPTWKAVEAPKGIEQAPLKKPEQPKLAAWPITGEELLGHFPKGFSPRPQQKIALEKIAAAYAAGGHLEDDDPLPGGGKSLACKTVANAAASRGGTHFLTSQKVLQDQYERDFPAPDIEVLKGRGNYPCSLDEGRDCSNAPCTDRKKGILPECVKVDVDLGKDGSAVSRAVKLTLKPHELLCPYWKQLQKCHDSKITLFNFSSFLFQQRIGRFQKRELMILDEAHNTEQQLMSFVSMELTEWALSIVNVRIDRDIQSKEQFAEWLRETDLLRKIDKVVNGPEEGDSDDMEDLDKVELEAMKELQGKIATFLQFLDRTEWILEVVEYEKRGILAKKIVARPLYAKTFAEDLLFRHASRVLCMSATILDVRVWAENLGLDVSEVELIQTPCDFPIENRPINLDYCGNMGYKFFSPRNNPTSPTRPKFIAKVATILGNHTGQRGIIHSQSFDLARCLIEDLRDKRLLFQEDFASKDEMLAEHARRKDSVLVAPALHEGLDLKDDLARFTIIAKVPWPSLGDKVMKERAARDDRYYSWLTALKIVQSYGRAVRSKDDWATTYIVDQGFDGFVAKHGNSMLPKWFMEAVLRGPAMRIADDVPF